MTHVHHVGSGTSRWLLLDSHIWHVLRLSRLRLLSSRLGRHMLMHRRLSSSHLLLSQDTTGGNLMRWQTRWTILTHCRHRLLWRRKLWYRTDTHLAHIMSELTHSVGWHSSGHSAHSGEHTGHIGTVHSGHAVHSRHRRLSRKSTHSVTG